MVVLFLDRKRRATLKYFSHGIIDSLDHWTIVEGGVRGVGLIWSSKYLSRPGRVSNQTLHITDWLPTLLRAAGGHSDRLKKIDGLDAWEALSKDKESPRKTILHNIDDIIGTAAITVNDWKLIKGICTRLSYLLDEYSNQLCFICKFSSGKIR